MTAARRWPRSFFGWCAHLLMAAFHAGSVYVGVLGFWRPSPTLAAQYENGWSVYVWSSIFAVFGLICLTARLLRIWKLEALALTPQAAGLMIWSAALLAGADNGAQIGSQLGRSSLLLLAFACFVFDWLWMQRGPVGPALDEISTAMDKIHEKRARDGADR